MSAAPSQSTAGGWFSETLPSGLVSEGGGGGGRVGMSKIPATVMTAERMASAPNTHLQLAYSAMRPERRLPHTLPRGAPAP